MIDYRPFITADPGVCHGKPCFRGTRVMVSAVLEMLAAGATTREIGEAYPRVTKKSIEAALFFAAQSLEHTQFHYLKH
ncbi:MAG: DUF433 domain-containing protein [Elusimicrobiota bacterium]